MAFIRLEAVVMMRRNKLAFILSAAAASVCIVSVFQTKDYEIVRVVLSHLISLTCDSAEALPRDAMKTLALAHITGTGLSHTIVVVVVAAIGCTHQWAFVAPATAATR